MSEFPSLAFNGFDHLGPTRDRTRDSRLRLWRIEHGSEDGSPFLNGPCRLRSKDVGLSVLYLSHVRPPDSPYASEYRSPTRIQSLALRIYTEGVRDTPPPPAGEGLVAEKQDDFEGE